jgi:hypothetical protein
MLLMTTHKYSIVWKDSAKNTKILMSRNMDELIKANDKLRFLVCARCPMDTAESIDHSGYASNYRSNEKHEIMKELFERYEWFFKLQDKYQENFMCLFPNEINDASLTRLEQFLKVDHDQRWVDDVQRVWVNKKKYDHNGSTKKLYRELVSKHIPLKYQHKFLSLEQ